MGAASVAAKPVVTDVRIGDHADKTRLVLEFNQPISYKIFALPDPYRVVIDLPDLEWSIPPGSGLTKQGLIKGYRYGLFDEDTFRVVVDLKSPALVVKDFMLPPNKTAAHRLVLDIAKTNRSAFMQASKKMMSRVSKRKYSPAPQAPIQKQTKRTGKQVIVIDAGHGGVDPGAIGASGRYEKRVTLSAAKTLKAELEKTGRYKVVLTRNRDIFLRLSQRVNVARKYGADLFISLHADSHPNLKVSGTSVYTLSEKASDKEAARLARKENKADLIAGVDLSHEAPDVSNILLDLAQRETMNYSAKFAAKLVGNLKKRVTLLRNTHRFAGFAVLKAPDVPSVLIELGYMSNPGDERRLFDKNYVKKMMGGIRLAIDDYFKWKDQLQQL